MSKRSCARQGCEKVLERENAEYCSEGCRNKAYRMEHPRRGTKEEQNALTKVHIQLPVGVVLRPTELILPDDIGWENFCELLAFLAQIRESNSWWIGDALFKGEMRGDWGEMYSQALTVFPDYDISTIQNFVWVSSMIPSSRRREECSWGHHREVAPLKSDEQEYWLKVTALAENWRNYSTEEITTMSWGDIVNNRPDSGKILSRSELRRLIRQSQRKPPPDLPEDKFNIILVDPPWHYEYSPRFVSRPEEHYDTLELEEIIALTDSKGEPITEKFADNSVLFLWATAPKMPDAFKLMEAWGFEYKTHGAWNKVILGMGYWLRGQHEPFLIGVRGEFSPPKEENRQESVIVEKRQGHSVKPDAIYTLIERSFPEEGHKRLDIFARQEREGWTCWGNELTNDR